MASSYDSFDDFLPFLCTEILVKTQEWKGLEPEKKGFEDSI
jgi:hypothetical protein